MQFDLTTQLSLTRGQKIAYSTIDKKLFPLSLLNCSLYLFAILVIVIVQTRFEFQCYGCFCFFF